MWFTYRFGEEENSKGDDSGCDKLTPNWDSPSVVSWDVRGSVCHPTSDDGSDRPHTVVETREGTSPL